jgi:Skp family chaperone for outer membrane proteins
MRRLRALLAAAVLAAAPAAAQEGLSMGQVQSSILTIDVDRLLAETLYGQRISADVRARGETLAAENERLAAELTAEERSLTERRPMMDPEAFRAEADAFDAKVQRIRSEQDAKERALEAAVAEGRAAFLEAATPVLARLMAESGAVAMLERRSVFLSAAAIDVTEEAIAAVDAAIGEGQPLPAPAEVPPAPADPLENDDAQVPAEAGDGG